MEHLRADVSHNSLPGSTGLVFCSLLPDLSLDGALLAIWPSVVNLVAALYYSGNEDRKKTRE